MRCAVLHHPKSNPLLSPVRWCVRDTLVLKLSLLSSPATIDICSRWEANADQTNTVDLLLFPLPDTSMTVEQHGEFVHLNTPPRPQITCSVAPATPQTLTAGSHLRLICIVLCATRQTLTQVPECERRRFKTSPPSWSRNKSDEALFRGSLFT